jgi:pyridoxal phosphate enzyme (YggS family)
LNTIAANSIPDRLAAVRARITQAALRSGRPAEQIQLVAVAKTQPADAVRAMVVAGAQIIAENYIQEAREKFDALIDLPIQWHYIGHLQSNKAKYAVRMFALIHTVDSLHLAEELDRQAGKAGKVQKILIQVNVGGEVTKSGVAPEGAEALVRAIAGLPHLEIRGLMALPPFFDAPQRVRPYFAQLRRLSESIAAQHIDKVSMAELSMGMTGDFEVAIEEGATLVRIGTALFGERR